jgi:hypothetical protein
MLNLRLARPMLIALAACAANFLAQGSALADDAQDNKALKEQMRLMMQRMDALQKQVETLTKQQATAPAVVIAAPPPPPPTVVAPIPAPQVQGPAVVYVEKEPLLNKILSGFYGTLDVSFDDTTKGIQGLVAYHYQLNDPANPNSGSMIVPGSAPKGGPVGVIGYMPAFSTNKSVLGYRGSHQIEGSDIEFIYQIETQPSITSSPGLNTSQYQQSNVVKGGIGYGDTFIGFSDKEWGKVKVGTTYSPYKKSTDRMNPFSGMLGDYAVVMGNSGGDNRVEFGTRLEHSIWYESPKFWNAFSFDVLVSPGQNRFWRRVQHGPEV